MEVVRKGQGVIFKLTKFYARDSRAIIDTQACRCIASKSSVARGRHEKVDEPTPPRVPEVGNAGRKKAEKISYAMKAYIERSNAHDQFMQSELEQFETGKRHLANIMSLDSENMTQDDVDKAIEYLLPSGLFDKKARPQMKHPSVYIPARKAAQFSADGRPFNAMFYTGFPNYYNKMHSLAMMLDELNQYEDNILKTNPNAVPIINFTLAGTKWMSQAELQDKLTEKVPAKLHENLIVLLKRLAEHPYAYRKKEEILSFTNEIREMAALEGIKEMKYDEDGRPYQTSEGRRKKSAKAYVTVRGRGSGLVNINGEDLIGFFPYILDREQIMFPLQFTGLLQEVDLEIRVRGEGHSAQAGAVRYALSLALRSFVEAEMVEKMRMAGLLSKDVRSRERKKPGQRKARKKMTWKKR